MKKVKLGNVVRLTLIPLLLAPLFLSSSCQTADPTPETSASPDAAAISLPEPRLEGDVSVEETLSQRRSVRAYASEPLALAKLGQLLWAAQGITGENRRYRTAPSAGALYPLELYALATNVEGLESGVYRYDPAAHALEPHRSTADPAALTEAALGQTWVEDGAAVLIFAAIYARTTQKYGARGRQYVHMEAGHAAQNVYLQATALELGTVAVGAFDDAAVKRVVGLADDEEPLYLMPAGHLR